MVSFNHANDRLHFERAVDEVIGSCLLYQLDLNCRREGCQQLQRDRSSIGTRRSLRDRSMGHRSRCQQLQRDRRIGGTKGSLRDRSMDLRVPVAHSLTPGNPYSSYG